MYILASASPRRKELIKLISDDVKVIPADCDETVKDGLSAKETVEYLSKIKGAAVKKYAENGDTIISADTVVCLDGKILGKPGSIDEAYTMLRSLSGNTHEVYTGVTLIKGENTHTFSQCTKVTFYELSDTEIKSYIATGDPFDKAGAYGIQTAGALLVKGIDGDYNNVVGLPVALLKRELCNFTAE